MTERHLADLIDQRRDLSAQIAGVELQIAMAVGDRDAARRCLAEMNAQTLARYAARFSACKTTGGDHGRWH